MSMKNEVYDVLKWVAMLLLPALATLVATVGSIWGLPYADQISQTIVAVNAALAMILGISTINYKAGGDQE